MRPSDRLLRGAAIAHRRSSALAGGARGRAEAARGAVAARVHLIRKTSARHPHAGTSPRQWPMQQVIKRVVDAVGFDGTIAGEAVDLHSEESKLDFDTLEFIHSRKTGALFVAAAAVGGMLANISPAALARIETFAKNLGLAFQITDDVLDVVGTPEVLGKDVGKDAQRLTFVKLAGVEGARKLSEELVETSLSAIANLGPAAAPLRELAVMVRDRVK